MTKPSTDELIDDLRNLKIEYCDLDTVNAAADRLETLRKAAEGMAEALRGVSESATDHEQGYISQMEISVTAVDRCAAALAAYEATK